MAGVIEIMESVRTIVNHWANTQVPLTADGNVGDTTLTIKTTNRFQVGDEIIIRDQVRGEINNLVLSIPDQVTLELTYPLTSNWPMSTGALVQKVFNGQMIQGIYMGEPDNIPIMQGPAITVRATTKDSEWLTIKSTKEDYKIEVTVYTKAAAQETGYRGNIRLAETIIYGLKKNIYPLVAPYTVVTLLVANIGDVVIKVADTTGLQSGSRIILEDQWQTDEHIVKRVIDSQTLELYEPVGCMFDMTDTPKMIVGQRFIYNSWPNNITYGEVFKGTLLKAAKITWFAWEEILWLFPPRETFVH